MEEILNEWKRYLTFAALLSCFVNILQLTFPFYMFSIYRNVVVSYSGYSLTAITVAACYALCCFGIFHYVRSGLLACAGADLSKKLKRRVVAGMIDKRAVMGGRAYTQGIGDLEILRDFLSSPAVYALFDLPWAPFYYVLIFFIHPGLGTIAFGGALIIIGLSVLQEFLIRDSMTQANVWNAKNQSFVNAFLRNTEVINGMGMTGAVADWFDKSNDRVILNQTRSSRHAGLIQSVMKPMQNVIQVMIYCFGAYYAMTQGFSVGLMVAASIIMGRGLAPVMQATASWKTVVRARQTYRRLQPFEKQLARGPEKMPLPLPAGRIALEGATYIAGGKALVSNITFSITPGEFIGLVGPSGAGKSTLCRLILGIWPCTLGQVSIDGMDAFKWDKSLAGRNIGYLPQEIELFPGTLAENIARMGRVDMEKVEAVVELCGMNTFVETLAAGYDTVLEGEGGIRLSGGQKQMVGMAMALYGSPEIIVLDEPTSNLDPVSETMFITALTQLRQSGQATCILVTHKPALLHGMDRIVVIRHGQVARVGKSREVFAELYGGLAGKDEKGGK